LIRRATENGIPRITEIRNNVRENKLIDPTRHRRACAMVHLQSRDIPLGGGWSGRGIFCRRSAKRKHLGAFMDQAYEGRGIARALLEQACAVLKDAGFERMWLTTDPGTRAEAFYRAAGWNVIGHRGSELLFEATVASR
jgi:GNAT superfamily N-acetyltransferase